MRNLLLILFITPSLLIAQNKAKEILDRVSQTTEAYNTIQATFINSIISKATGINESKEGTLYLKDDLYRLEMKEQTIISDGETNWIHLINEKEVQIIEIDEEEETISPSKMFTLYQEGYKYNFIEEKDDQYIIDLIPEESGAFIKIELRIDKAKMHVRGFTLFDKNDNLYSYNIINLITNEKIDDDLFYFDISEKSDLDIIDLR